MTPHPKRTHLLGPFKTENKSICARFIRWVHLTGDLEQVDCTHCLRIIAQEKAAHPSWLEVYRKELEEPPP